MIQAGQRYKLSGLAAAHLNGKTCKIRRYDEEKKRWIVDLDADLEKNNDAPKALRAENLKPITEPPLGGPSTPPPAAAQPSVAPSAVAGGGGGAATTPTQTGAGLSANEPTEITGEEFRRSVAKAGMAPPLTPPSAVVGAGGAESVTWHQSSRQLCELLTTECADTRMIIGSPATVRQPSTLRRPRCAEAAPCPTTSDAPAPPLAANAPPVKLGDYGSIMYKVLTKGDGTEAPCDEYPMPAKVISVDPEKKTFVAEDVFAAGAFGSTSVLEDDFSFDDPDWSPLPEVAGMSEGDCIIFFYDKLNKFYLDTVYKHDTSPSNAFLKMAPSSFRSPRAQSCAASSSTGWTCRSLRPSTRTSSSRRASAAMSA